MKRKLRLLLAMVLAMTMVMGIGVTAFAEQISEIKIVGTLPIMYDTQTVGDYVASLPLTFTDQSGNNLVVDFVEIDKPRGVAQEGDYFDVNVSYTIVIKFGNQGDGFSSECSCPEGWIVLSYPDADGLEGEVCSICGATRNTQSLSAYGYALNDYAISMINATKSGQTITFEFGEWNSFPKSFMEKLVEKNGQNVTFIFHYKWNHVKQEIIIPAGTPIDLNFDWYGPAKMAELYGAN